MAKFPEFTLLFPTQPHIDAAKSSGEYWYRQKGVYSFPSFRLAQTAIESANGTALSGENNYWGVKANKAQIAAGKFKLCRTHEVINGQTVAIMDKFASYDSLEQGYIDQAKLLVTSSYYEKSRHDDNPKQYAIDVAVHYATAPNYAKVLIAYMDQHNLYQYDNIVHPTDEQVKLNPPAHLEQKAQIPAAAGAVVLGSTTVATVATQNSHLGVVIAGILIALICAGIAWLRYRQAQKVLADILTPPTEEEIANVRASIAPKVPVEEPAPTPVEKPVVPITVLVPTPVPPQS